MATESTDVQQAGDDLEKLKLSTRKDRPFDKAAADEALKKAHEQKLKELKMVAEKVIGTVKWYSVLSHYGFIGIDGKDEDVFVHQSSILESRTNRLALRTLDNGEKVQFDIVENGERREAVNVTGPNGAPVIGSRFQWMQIPWLRSAFFQHRDGLHGKDQKKPGNRSEKPKTNNVRSKKDNEASGDDKSEKKPRRRNNSTRSNRRNQKEKSENIEPAVTGGDAIQANKD